MASNANLMVFALPLLIGIALVEAWLYPKLLARRFPWAEAWTSIGVAAGQMLIRIVGGGLTLGWFFWLWSVTPMRIPVDTIWGVALLLLTVELVYYWHHRLSHEIRWFWATHAVHHSPNHLNFSAAIRLGWTGEVSGAALVFSPAILVGFHPLAVLGMLGVNLIYQFFVHSEYLPKLGPLEKILNTPSNHRVHHASNPAYLDRNYGGMLILYDRLFGTYVEENNNDPPRYGLVKPLMSHNPLHVALHEWLAIGRDFARVRGWRNRLMVLFGPPGWAPDQTVDIEINSPVPSLSEAQLAGKATSGADR
jgi:sterol desaturase/sphingolipid hydroxylase (fatty acid hydroxylase superfamily)